MKVFRITSGAFGTIVPEVNIRREGENILVKWKGLLQSATYICGPWQDVADDSQSPIILGSGEQLSLIYPCSF